MKKIIVGMTTVAVVTLSSVFFTGSVQANIGELENKQTEVESERSAVKSKLSKADAEIADVLFDLKEINNKIAQVESALKENEAMLDKTTKQVEKTEDEIEALEDEIKIIEERIEARTEILKQRISSYQQTGGDIAYLDVIFGAKDFSEFISLVSAVTKITNADTELIKEQEADKAEVEEKQETVEEKLAEQKEKQVELKEMKGIIQEQKEENEKSKKKLEKKEKELLNLKADLESEDSNLTALEAQIRQDISAARNPAPTESSSDLSTLSSANSSGSAAGNSSGGSSGGSSIKSNSPKASTPSVSTGGGGKGSVISAGNRFIGNSKYVYGAADAANGRFDCSGFVNWAFAQGGYSVPRTTGALANSGTSVSRSDMQPGDLVFFNTNGHNGHVGIYIGGGNFIGSQSSTGVAVQSLNSGYWAGQFSGTVRRIN